MPESMKLRQLPWAGVGQRLLYSILAGALPLWPSPLARPSQACWNSATDSAPLDCMQSRLIRKGETEADARTAVEWMVSHDLVDDRTTARQVAESCASKGYGLARAKQALYEKRIPRQYWEEALADYPDQAEKILSFLRTRLSGDCDQRDIQRAVAALTRRGHSYASIREGLRQLSLETDELPADE